MIVFGGDCLSTLQIGNTPSYSQHPIKASGGEGKTIDGAVHQCLLFAIQRADRFQFQAAQLIVNFSLSIYLPLTGGTDALLYLLIGFCFNPRSLIQQFAVFNFADLNLQVYAIQEGAGYFAAIAIDLVGGAVAALAAKEPAGAGVHSGNY